MRKAIKKNELFGATNRQHQQLSPVGPSAVKLQEPAIRDQFHHGQIRPGQQNAADEVDSIPSADVPLLLSFSLISSYASASKNILLVGISYFFICLKSWYPSSTSIRLTFPPLPWASLPTSRLPYLQPTPGHESIWIHMNPYEFFKKSQLNLWVKSFALVRLPSSRRRTLGHLVQGFSSPAKIPTAGEILSHHLPRCHKYQSEIKTTTPKNAAPRFS